MINFTAIDFETANAQRGSVCAVGITKVHDGQIVRSTSCLVSPPQGLDRFAPANIRVHGIKPSDVRGAAGWPRVWRAMIDIIGTDIVVAHNAPFERSVIRAASQAEGVGVPPLHIACTVKMAKLLLPDLPKHKLPFVAEALGVLQAHHHDAGDDARVCAEVCLAMVTDTGCDSLERMLSLLRIQPTPLC